MKIVRGVKIYWRSKVEAWRRDQTERRRFKEKNGGGNEESCFKRRIKLITTVTQATTRRGRVVKTIARDVNKRIWTRKVKSIKDSWR